MFDVAVPLMGPKSVATPELSIFIRFPAVRPEVVVLAMPYMNPSWLLKPMASIPPKVFGPISYEVSFGLRGSTRYS